MSKHVAAPALAVDVRELLQRPGAHKHVVVRAPERPGDPGRLGPARPAGHGRRRDRERGRGAAGHRPGLRHRGGPLRPLPARPRLRPGGRGARAVRPRAAPGRRRGRGLRGAADDRLPLDTMARDALVLGFPAFPLCRPTAPASARSAAPTATQSTAATAGPSSSTPLGRPGRPAHRCSGGRRCKPQRVMGVKALRSPKRQPIEKSLGIRFGARSCTSGPSPTGRSRTRTAACPPTSGSSSSATPSSAWS